MLLADIFMVQTDVATGVPADDGVRLGDNVLGKSTVVLMPGVQDHGTNLSATLSQLVIVVEHGKGSGSSR